MNLFRIPKITEYALRSLSCVARSGQRRSVREIAACEHIPPATLSKILHMLCRHGLVHSKRGRAGGFWLAREAERIRLQDVVEIFEGPMESEETWSEGGFPVAWESLCAPSRQAVERMTLADLIRLEQEREAAVPARGSRKLPLGTEGRR